MYEVFYGLKEKPFQISPDPRFLFLTPQHQEVLSKCEYMIFGRIGPVYVFGPIGSGKTTIARRLHQKAADTEGTVVASLIAPDLKTPNQFLRAIALEFGVKTERSFDGTLRNFTTFLRDRHSRGTCLVLIIDEAQTLRRPLLRLLHFLLNYETNTVKMLQLVLFGQNELALHIDALPELKSRMFPSALNSLNALETAQMIEYRMTVAGRPGAPFTLRATQEVYRRSLGLPRTVCQICDMALIGGFAAKEVQIDSPRIRSAAQELRLNHGGSP